MSTSAEPTASDRELVLTPHRYTDPDVVRLVEQVQAEYVVRYGGPDATPVEPTQFDPPGGLFLLGYLNGTPVACGGWRTLDTGIAEIKRMYVSADSRRQGLAEIVLAELERTAAAAGLHRLVLETGSAQPEAIAMYAKHGFEPVAPFGHYRDAPGAIHLGKPLH